ncbi:MAG: DUF3999 family protein [Dehalococcoidia bacterium]
MSSYISGNLRIGLSGLGLVLLLLGSTLGVVLADFSLTDWRYQKEIVLPAGIAAEGLAELEIDAEVFTGAAPELADLRLVRSASEEVPYHLAIARGSSQRTAVDVRVQDLGHVPGAHSSFVVDLGREGMFHNELEISTTSENFQREVKLEGSNDRAAWKVLGEGVKIFNLTLKERNFSTGDTRVAYPESTVRYLRVSILNAAEQPLEIGGAAVFSIAEEPPQRAGYPATITDRRDNEEQRSSTVTVDLGRSGLPTSRLSLVTDQVNFYREVFLEGSDDAETWRSVQRAGALYAYNTPRFTGSSLELDYPEVTLRYLRLTIRNEDNPPIEFADLRISGLVRKLKFQPQPEGQYRLFYGNPEARTPSYDLDRFLPYLELENIPQASLGPQVENPQFRIPQPPVSERYPWLITVGVAVAAVVVALLLFGVLRQAKKFLPPPEETSE